MSYVVVIRTQVWKLVSVAGPFTSPDEAREWCEAHLDGAVFRWDVRTLTLNVPDGR